MFRRAHLWLVFALALPVAGCGLLPAVECNGCGALPVVGEDGPRRRNLALFTPGTRRYALLAEFGEPKHMEIRDGTRYDLFRFVPWKYRPKPRPNGVVEETLANLPLPFDTHRPTHEERIVELNEPEVMVEVIYTREDYVMTVVPMKGAELLPVADAGPAVRPSVAPAVASPYSAPRSVAPVNPVITSSIR